MLQSVHYMTGLTGPVRDSSGTIIVDSELTLQNATAVARKTLSNSIGQLRVRQCAAGYYILEARQNGFELNHVQPFTLAANQTATIKILSRIGSLTQSVTVCSVLAMSREGSMEIPREVGAARLLVEFGKPQPMPISPRGLWVPLAGRRYRSVKAFRATRSSMLFKMRESWSSDDFASARVVAGGRRSRACRDTAYSADPVAAAL